MNQLLLYQLVLLNVFHIFLSNNVLAVFGCASCCVLWLSRYESVIATLCENLDSLDEPEARAAMIWIVGEYAERIDNADELLESFLEGFHDESTQVCLFVCFLWTPLCWQMTWTEQLTSGINILHPLGAAAAADSNRQTVPEKADWDPGARAAGVEPRHTGEKTCVLHLCYAHVMLLSSV